MATTRSGSEAGDTYADTQAPDDLAEIVTAALVAWRATHRRFPGLGHRQHATVDPRVERLWALAQEAGLPTVYVRIERQIAARAAEMVGRPLPVNIDGATAAILCAMEVPASLGNAFFYLARLAGVLAHAYEEQQRMPPMRRIHPTDHGYDGPQPIE